MVLNLRSFKAMKIKNCIKSWLLSIVALMLWQLGTMDLFGMSYNFYVMVCDFGQDLVSVDKESVVLDFTENFLCPGCKIVRNG